jgi:hypothetical protein
MLERGQVRLAFVEIYVSTSMHKVAPISYRHEEKASSSTPGQADYNYPSVLEEF